MSNIINGVRQFRFYLHYNKPMSRLLGTAVWTVHWKNKCYQALRIKVHVPVETYERNQQPKGVVRGKAGMLELKGPMAESDSLFTVAHLDEGAVMNGNHQCHTLIEGEHPAAQKQ